MKLLRVYPNLQSSSWSHFLQKSDIRENGIVMDQYMIYWEIEKKKTPTLQTLKTNTEAVPICRI